MTKRRRKLPPSPLPTASRQLTIPEVLTVAKAAGFTTTDQLLTVLAIGIAESSLWSGARNWHPEYGTTACDRGIWQISSHWWPQYTDAQCDDPAQAAKIVWTLSNSGTDFTPWDTYQSGAAQRHYDEAFDGWPALRPLVT